MNYCILRAEKLTSFGAVAGSATHTSRETPTPNEHPKRTHLNRTFVVRMQPEPRARLKAATTKAGRGLDSEILARLGQSLREGLTERQIGRAN